MKIVGKPINIKYLQPFWSSCYVFIPLAERAKLGARRAYKAKFCGYSTTFLLLSSYFVIPYENGKYGRIRESKDIIFDPTIDISIYTNDEELYDREFVHTDHYVPFLHRKSAPDELQGELAQPYVEPAGETFEPDFPENVLANQNRNDPNPFTDTNENNTNIVNMPYTDGNNVPVYWYNLNVRNDEYALSMCETQHYSKLGVPIDPRVPKCFNQAVHIPAWKAAIDKETVVPYNGQQLVW